MTTGFRVAIPGKDARTAIPKEVITDTTLISLPIHWEGPVDLIAPGGLNSGAGDVSPITATGIVEHDLNYAPLTRAWSTLTQYDGTEIIESPTAKGRVPVNHDNTFPMLIQCYGYKDRVEIKAFPAAAGIAVRTWAGYTLHAYLYIFEFQPDEWK